MFYYFKKLSSDKCFFIIYHKIIFTVSVSFFRSQAIIPTEMSVNSSVTSLFDCMDNTAAVSVLSAFVTSKVLLCSPLAVFVLYLGYQQWRLQHSTKNMSHSDFFTYNMAVLALSNSVSAVFYLFGNYTHYSKMATAALYAFSIYFPGEMSFHCLTSVDRYLAVVHPIVYRRLRHSSGVRIRNISIGCAWLLSLAWIGLKLLYFPGYPIVPFFSSLALALLAVSFCSLSVLCALIRPGPGDVGADERRVDQSKQRAFHTVVAILAVLCFWFIGTIVCFSVQMLLSYSDSCILMMIGMWFSTPSTPLLPLLFLHRAGKLQLCRYSSK